MNKKKDLNLKLNSVETVDNDPTILKATYVILDFEKSWNNTIISKEVALSLAKTVKNKPIVANYIPVTQTNTNTDNFTGHEASLEKDKYGVDQVKTNTATIGVFTTDGYITTISVDGLEREVLAADAVLHRSRYSDACDLLMEWYSRGVDIKTSCEFLYSNFSFVDGIEYIDLPVYFEGHCHLGSESRGGYDAVAPAYDSSKLISFNEYKQFEKFVAQANTNTNDRKDTDMLFKKIFELSHSDVRSQIYKELDPTIGEDAYSFIYDVYDDHFVVNIENSTESKYFDYKYSKNDEAIVIDFDSKSEVKEKREWAKVPEVQNLQTQLNEITEKYEQASDKLIKLNAEMELVKPYKDKWEQEEFNKALNEKIHITKRSSALLMRQTNLRQTK